MSMFKITRTENGTNLIEVKEKDVKGLANAAFYSVAVEQGCNIPEGAKTEPDAAAGLIERMIYHEMVNLVKDGMKLNNSMIAERSE